MALCLMVYAVLYSVHKGEDKERIHQEVDALRKKGFWNLIKEGFWALLTPVILLGGIYSGVVTPTEVAALSVLYALIVSVFIYRSIRPREIWTMLVETSRSLAPLALMIAAAVAFGRVLTLLRVPSQISTFMITHFSNKIAILLIVNFILLLIGMVMDTAPAILIFSTMLMPLMTQLGVDPIHLGIIMTVNMAIGFISPPFGMTLFVASPLVNEKPLALGATAVPFILAELISLLIITFVPWLSMTLV